MKFILDYLRDPAVAGIDIDGDDRLIVHRKILTSKPMLRSVFVEFHRLFHELDRKHLSGNGLRVELGAGVAPMQETYPDVLATDVVPGLHLDRVINAEDMELPDGSVRVFFGQNCFHHFPHPDRFFSELDRVLVPGGGAILLEPYYGPFAEYLFKRLFATEGFDKSYPLWDVPVAGPMNGANQALSFVVFVRDRSRFERTHPSLEIVHEGRVGNYLKYLLSGGLNFRPLWPNAMSPVVSVFQWILSPFNRWLCLHHVVVIRKKSE